MNRRDIFGLMAAAPLAAVAEPRAVAAGFGKLRQADFVSDLRKLGPGVLLQPVELAVQVDAGEARNAIALMKVDLAEILRMRRLCGIPDEPIAEDLMLVDGAGI